MLDHVLHLLAHSPNHYNYTIEQIARCIIPPLKLEQYRGIVEDGHLVGFVTWAFIPREKADIFLDGEYKIQPSDWKSGDVLVFMDFVAPFGHAKQLVRMVKDLFPDYPKAEWRRHSKSKRVGVKVNV